MVSGFLARAFDLPDRVIFGVEPEHFCVRLYGCSPLGMTVPSSMLGGHGREKIGERKKKKKAWCGSALHFLWRELRGMAIQLFRSMLLGGVDVCWCCRDIGLLHDKYWGQKYSIRA